MQKKWAYLSLFALAATTVWLASTLPHTYFDYDFDKFFKPSDRETQYFEQHRNTFGTDNDFILVGIVNRKGIFNTAFYDQLRAFTDSAAALPHILQVVSPTNLTLPVREPLTGFLFQQPLFTGHPEKDSLRVVGDPSLMQSMFATDTSAVSILLLTEERLSKEKSDVIASRLEALLGTFHFDGVHTAGRSIGQVVYINKIQYEFALFMGIAMIFVVLLLYVMFRSFRGIVLPMVTVLLAVVWSIGILNLAGSGVGLLLSMLPPVIFVVGMSDAVHLYARYLEELRRGQSQRMALRQMVFDTGLATLLTSVTTAIGFASLYFTGIPTLQEFGLLTAAGVLAAYVIAITMMPAWLSLTAPPLQSLTHRPNAMWDEFLEKMLPKILRRRRLIFGSMAALAIIFAVSTSQLGLNNYLLEDLRPGEKLKQDFTFFDEHFAGVRPFELGIKLRQGGESLIDRAHFENMAILQDYLETTYGVAAVQSPVSLTKAVNRTYNAGRNEHYRLPETEQGWNNVQREMLRLKKLGKMHSIIDSTGSHMRFYGRAGDWGAQAFAAKNEALKEFISSSGMDEAWEVEITGTGTLIDRTNQNLVYSLAKGLGVAFLLVSLIMGFMFKSLRMVIIALIPNILPLLAVAAVMYWLGIDLKMSTSIIFTIAFGIAVDDTIHLLSRYKLELVKGMSNTMALRHAFVHTGKALIITSIILFGGFISLCFSSFQSTFYIGLLVTLTLAFALAFDLTLLPALISLLPEQKIHVDKSESDPTIDPSSHNPHHGEEQSESEREIKVPG